MPRISMILYVMYINVLEMLEITIKKKLLIKLYVEYKSILC